MDSVRAFLRRHRSTFGALVGCVLVGVLAGGVALALQPATRGSLGPGEVSVGLGVGSGSTALDIPPLGRLVADSHRGPMGIDVAVDRLDLEQLGALAGELARGSDPATTLRTEISGDLPELLRSLALRSLGAAALGGVVAGLLLPRRRPRYVMATTVGAVGAAVAVGAVTFSSFSPRAFDEPRFEGTIAAAPDIIGTVQRHIDDVSVVESRLEALAARLVSLYQTVETGGSEFSDVTILHVSDLHSNLLGIELVEQTAERFEVDAVLDTGDLTSFGSSIELITVMRVAGLDVPYHVVPGNHDHPNIRRALREAGVSVLDPGVVTIEGIRILGVGDPAFTADNETSSDGYQETIERSARDVARRVRRERPDLVAVHNPRQLEEAHGLFDVGLAGHVHRFDLQYEDGSVITTAGSAGATGVGALAEVDDLPYQMQLLQFEDGRLVAVDRLSFEGTDGEFRLERQLVDPDRVAGYPNTIRPESNLFPPLLRPGRQP